MEGFHIQPTNEGDRGGTVGPDCSVESVEGLYRGGLSCFPTTAWRRWPALGRSSANVGRQGGIGGCKISIIGQRA